MLLVAGLCASLASGESPESRAAIVISSALVPMFIATGEREIAPATSLWITAGAGNTRVTPAFADNARRAVWTTGVGVRRYLNENYFVHGDVGYTHVSGSEDELVSTSADFGRPRRPLAALYLPGLSIAAGLGGVIALDPFYLELSFVARWVLTGRRKSSDAPNVYANRAFALLPAIAVGLRF